VGGLLGVATPKGLRGRDLLAPGATEVEVELYLAPLGEWMVARRALVSGDYKLVASASGGAEGVQLFRGGDETRDLAAEEPEVVARLSRELSELRASLGGGAAVREQDLSGEDRRALEALGYLEPEDE
jgi:hypothetical protein